MTVNAAAEHQVLSFEAAAAPTLTRVPAAAAWRVLIVLTARTFTCARREPNALRGDSAKLYIQVIGADEDATASEHAAA